MPQAADAATGGQHFAPIEPFESGFLDTGDGHQIYYEVSGNPAGEPVLVVHGGPGGGTNPTMRRYHDPAHYRIVLFDQRGCGRSTPNASLANNTTWHLVADMEQLRERLRITRWQLFGGSWGSTLSLAYAERHPERVTGLIVRGIFLFRRSELDWFYQEGASWVFPDAFERFKSLIPEAERGDLRGAYYKLLGGTDEARRLEAARAWAMWEGLTLSLRTDPARVEAFGAPRYALTFAAIESHYMAHGGFFECDGQLLRDAHRLAGIPGTIVHGRYDMCTPVKNAFDLKKVWPEAKLVVVEDAGHAMTEPGIVRGLVRATEAMKAAPSPK